MIKVADIIHRELTSYGYGIQDKMKKAIWQVGEETANELQKTSRKRRGNYARSWTVDKHKKNGVVVRNVKHYRLTHLLEYGHDLERNGVVYGSVRAYPHIRKAEQNAINKLVKEIEQSIGGK